MIKVYGTKLVLRIAVFLTAICLYFEDKDSLVFSQAFNFKEGIKPLHIIWLILIVEILQKFFPQKPMSMGCRKVFQSSYQPSSAKLTEGILQNWIRRENRLAGKVAWAWLGLNGLVGCLYFRGVIEESHLLLLSLFYFVCDITSILFYCPFQSLIMKNRCCVTCRIFNWDALMAYIPLVFVPGFFSWTLVGLAAILLVRWEWAYRRHPQRFFEGSNQSLQCKNCEEKLCKIKKPIPLHQAETRSLY